MKRQAVVGVVAGAVLIAIVAWVAIAERSDGADAAPVLNVSRNELEGRLNALGAPLRDGNAVEVVNNGAVFDALVQEIQRAEKSVHILLFIWRGSEPSDRVVKALLEKREQKLDCRVVIDPIASPNFREEVQPQLELAGCEVRFYKPTKQTLRQGDEGLERTHRKIVVVDGRVGITGGFGMWKSWLGEGLTKDEWRDTNARVRGPVVNDLQRAFAQTWNRVGGSPLDASDLPPQPAVGDARAAFVASDALEGERAPDGKTSAERLSELLIASAQERLWIANSYFVPTDPILAQLEAKARAGVDVRVLAPGPVHDWRTVRDAQRLSYRQLIKAGVRIYEYQPSMMHAKTFLIDDDLASIGSMNLDPLSLEQLEEGQLVVLDAPALVARLERDFLVDVSRSEQRLHEFPGPMELAARLLLWFIGAA